MLQAYFNKRKLKTGVDVFILDLEWYTHVTCNQPTNVCDTMQMSVCMKLYM